jgi:hypothetical protein
VDGAQPDEQEQRGEVLDRDGRTDLEPVDGQEVGGVHAREADHAEQRERGQVAALDPHQIRPRGAEHEQQEHPGPGRAQLR